MKLLSDSCFLLISVNVLLLVGLSRGNYSNEPTIVYDDDDDDEEDCKSKTTATMGMAFVKECKVDGFDPMQLACTTCSILPLKHQNRCRECCQSYRSLEKRTKRYEMAILLNTGFPEAVQDLVKDDTDGIVEQKGSSRFHVHDIGADMERMGMMGMFQQEPSAILWFDKPVSLDSTAQALAEIADETTIISGRGLGRDDIRDMLLTLLPDKE